MKLYVKWFYGYKNFGDEMLFFWLLNYLQDQYNPEEIVVEVWDKNRIQDWIMINKSYLDLWIIDKLDFVENTVVSKRFRQIQSILWFDKYKNHFKVFGGWEVLDESRNFPHNGRNLFLLHNYSIRKKRFILAWGIGTDQKRNTRRLYRFILPKAQKIICREEWSYNMVKKYSKKNLVLYKDFSEIVLCSVVRDVRAAPRLNSGERPLRSDNVVLINVWPKYYTKQNIQKIKKFVSKYPKHKKIFFAADINFDKEFYSKLRKIIPNLQIYDRTKHNLSETLSLFQNCQAWIWSRLHFLYPLKVFQKDFVSISDSNKVKKMI